VVVHNNCRFCVLRLRRHRQQHKPKLHVFCDETRRPRRSSRLERHAAACRAGYHLLRSVRSSLGALLPSRQHDIWSLERSEAQKGHRHKISLTFLSCSPFSESFVPILFVETGTTGSLEFSESRWLLALLLHEICQEYKPAEPVVARQPTLTKDLFRPGIILSLVEYCLYVCRSLTMAVPVRGLTVPYLMSSASRPSVGPSTRGRFMLS